MKNEFNRIVCYIDFTIQSAHALRKALVLAEHAAEPLLVTHVIVDPWSKLYKLNMDSPEKNDVREAHKSAESMLKDFVAEHARGRVFDHQVTSSINPDEAIVETAKTFNADAIVLAAEVRTAGGRLFKGSVAERVVSQAPCTVMLVRSSEGDVRDVLKNKFILVVDDEPDVLETVAELLDTSLVHKASDFQTARDYLYRYRYDIVILDIMGVNGFDLLKTSVEQGFPTVMLSAYALSAEAIEKSIQLGALFFLPKDKMSDIGSFLREVVMGGNKPIWSKVFTRLGSYFEKVIGPDWNQKESILRIIEKEIGGD